VERDPLETDKKLIARLEQDLDLNQRQIQAALNILGETNVAPERLAPKLVEIAERFKALQQTAIARPGDDPKIAALKADAQKAIAEGDLDKAEKLLADVELQQRQARERIAADEAKTAAQRGDIAMTRLRYGEAAKRYADAAAVLAFGSSGERKRLDYLSREAYALYQQGYDFGDNAALLASIDRYRRIIDLQPRARVPLDWARTQNDLCNALMILGERESSTERLEEAIATYREVLKEFTGMPLDKARTQNNLGLALRKLGERESGFAHLEEAVAAYREALKELPRKLVPLDWAAVQNNLGLALYNLGERESGTDRLKEAIAAYREALEEEPRERLPLDWATTQNNVGLALLSLGERESSTKGLEEAVAVFRDALKERTRERVPLDWAQTRSNLGEALLALGERESGTANLEDAVAAYRNALKEYTRERVPLDWARSPGDQAVALMQIAQRKRDVEIAQTPVVQIKTAYDTFAAVGHFDANYYEEQPKLAKSVAKQLNGH
jgi:tetratricopeptide (TPR) repeat protein